MLHPEPESPKPGRADLTAEGVEVHKAEEVIAHPFEVSSSHKIFAATRTAGPDQGDAPFLSTNRQSDAALRWVPSLAASRCAARIGWMQAGE